jgi:copper chaperone CopZ
MKRFVLHLFVTLLFLGCLSLGEDTAERIGTPLVGRIETGEMSHAFLRIEGMACPSCALEVEYALRRLPGVVDAEVPYPEGWGEVIYDPREVGKDEILRAVAPFRATITPVDKAPTSFL